MKYEHMKTVSYTATLFYYNGPQVIEARDTVGGHYVAAMIEPEQEHDRYLVVGVSLERLQQFRAGLLDLRTLMAEGAEDAWYLAQVDLSLQEPMCLHLQNASLLASGLLPDAGFVLCDRPT